jgi:hypothetical protein
VAERNPLCNCDAPMPAALCTAVCFERRDDVAPALPGKSDSACVSAGNSNLAAASAKNAGGEVLFECSSSVTTAPPMSVCSSMPNMEQTQCAEKARGLA